MTSQFKPKPSPVKSIGRVLLLFSIIVAPAGADDWMRQPLAISNHNPFIRIYGIPHPEPAIVRESGQQWDATLDISSNFTDAERADELIIIDGESYRLTLRGVFGLGNGWETGVEAPLIRHSGGSLDAFILDWHDLFGLPQLGRDQVANNQLRYQYRRGAATRINVDSSDTGLGDIVLFTGRKLPFGQRSALRMQVKLPTGEAERLFGSGGTDLALALQSDYAVANSWQFHGGVGGAYLGRGDVLPELQQNWVAFGNVGIVWQPLQRLALQLQLAGQTSIYKDTALHQLSDTAIQTTLGGTLKIAGQWYLDLAVSEDELAYDVSPDVSFHLRLRYRK